MLLVLSLLGCAQVTDTRIYAGALDVDIVSSDTGSSFGPWALSSDAELLTSRSDTWFTTPLMFCEGEGVLFWLEGGQLVHIRACSPQFALNLWTSEPRDSSDDDTAWEAGLSIVSFFEDAQMNGFAAENEYGVTEIDYVFDANSLSGSLSATAMELRSTEPHPWGDLEASWSMEEGVWVRP